MGRPRKFTSEFMAKVAIEALREESSLATLAKKYDVAPSKITEWKEALLRNASVAFEPLSTPNAELKHVKAENDRLLKAVGQLTIDRDFFAEACEKAKLKRR
ncbi:MAG: transposase [Bacteroidota bacterium]|nr:transposase [Bacteroidota bacterium]